MAVHSETLGSFHGSDAFPIEWQDGERELFWIYDDLHCPNPVSPLFFDIGGWWLTCDHMFRRFGTPFASDWVAKQINGYVYTAAIPADPGVRSEATEYQSRYAPRVPRDPEYAGRIGAYLGAVLPHYAEHFLDWWRNRLRPEIERNFAYLDGYDTESASLVELAVLLEDAIDIHDRHWKIHWMLNFAQFSSSTALEAAVAEARGAADPELLGRLQSSVEDRNWDSIEDLWKMKEEIKGDAELRAAFEADTAPRVLAALAAGDRGRRFIAERLEPHQQAFGYKAIWSHEFAYKLWVEDPAPIIEAVRGYLATDYDYRTNIQAVRDDLEAAKREVIEGVDGAARERLERALELSLRMSPLTPDHHFYIDQGTNARLRLAAIAIGRKLVAAGALDDPERRRLPALQRAAPAGRRPAGVRRPRARLRSPRRARGRGGAAPAVVGRHGHRGGARVPVRVAVGLPAEVPRRRAGDDRRDPRAAGVPRRRRGNRALCRVARRVRPGRAG